MATNPFFQVGQAGLSDSVRQHLVIVLTTYLQANATRQVIPDAELQALHPILATPAVWKRMQAELGL